MTLIKVESEHGSIIFRWKTNSFIIKNYLAESTQKFYVSDITTNTTREERVGKKKRRWISIQTKDHPGRPDNYEDAKRADNTFVLGEGQEDSVDFLKLTKILNDLTLGKYLPKFDGNENIEHLPPRVRKKIKAQQKRLSNVGRALSSCPKCKADWKYINSTWEDTWHMGKAHRTNLYACSRCSHRWKLSSSGNPVHPLGCCVYFALLPIAGYGFFKVVDFLV